MENIKKDDLITILKYAYCMSRLIRPKEAKEYGLQLAGDGVIGEFYKTIIEKIEKDERVDLSEDCSDELLREVYKTMKEDVAEIDIEYDGMFIIDAENI